MKKFKRALAMLLVVGMAFTSLPMSMASAQELQQNGSVNTVANEEQAATNEQQSAADEKEQTTGEAIKADASKLNYIYVESPTINTPGEQNIVVSYGDGSEDIENATLLYRKDEGKIQKWQSSKAADGAFLFTKKFTDKDSGIYDIVSVCFEKNGKTQEIVLEDIGYEAHFGVNKEYKKDTEEALEVQNDGSLKEKNESYEDNAVVEVDNSDMQKVSSDVKKAIQSQIPASRSLKSGNIVVYLDPGHDASHRGASANGLKEEVITLKIAQYCKAELEQYSGVTVKMTRASSACPYPGTDSGDCLTKRIQNAVKGGADAYVSIHLNSASSSANGAEVWYWYNNSEGKDLAEKVQAQLVALGLKNRGAKPDDPNVGSGTYAVTRECNKAGIPGIIIEHAFITGNTDSTFLKSEANIKKLGVADATGIVKTYGLSKNAWSAPKLKNTSATSKGVEIAWNAVKEADGYAVYRRSENTNWSMIDTVKGTSYLDTYELKSNTTYYYTVRAYKGDEDEALENRYDEKYWTDFDHNGVVVVGIDIPKLKSTETAQGGIKVQWEAVSGANGYAVYKNISGNSWQILGTTTSTSYIDKSDMTNGKKAKYTVRAYKGALDTANKNKYSAQYWSGFDADGEQGVYTELPEMTKTEATSAGVKVQWKAVSGAKSYAVYRSASGESWELIDTTTSTEYVDKEKLKNGTTYCYTVRACIGEIDTALENRYDTRYWSYFDADGIKAIGIDIPKLKSTETAQGGIKVQWEAVSGANGYAVYKNISGNSWQILGTTTSTSYIDKSDMTNGKKAKYTVRAYKGALDTANKNKYSAQYWSGFDADGIQGVYTDDFKTPSLKSTKVVNNGIQIEWNAVSGAKGYAVYRKTAKSEWTMIGTTSSNKLIDKNGGSSGTVYYYTVRAYRYDLDAALANKYDSFYWSSFDSTGISGSAYSIEGKSNTTVDKMVALFEKSGKEYPAEALKKGGAATIDDFAEIFYEEAIDEGIKPEVLWCQAMHETGYLQFGGDVDISQYNFGGLGATGGGAAGASFKNVREGARAQVQHLKAYASATITESKLKHDLVDPRFKYVKKGAAKYVEILGSKENPLGIGWATNKGYGKSILTLITKMNSI